MESDSVVSQQCRVSCECFIRRIETAERKSRVDTKLYRRTVDNEEGLNMPVIDKYNVFIDGARTAYIYVRSLNRLTTVGLNNEE